MTDAECIDFLQWALPRLGRRWPGYRKVRGLVAKRLGRRMRELGLVGLAAYRERLQAQPEEWAALDALLGIPISRFHRDRGVFESIGRDILPALAQAALEAGRTALDAWSAGCASGEEPYTLAMLWRWRVQPVFPALKLRIIATDCNATLLDRARVGCYAASSLKELPADLRAAAFEAREGCLCVRTELRDVAFLLQDVRQSMPTGPFDLVLLRNFVATYYAVDLQRPIIQRIADRIRLGGALVLGIHESLPAGIEGLAAWPGTNAILRRTEKLRREQRWPHDESRCRPPSATAARR
jgi:chemotaxis protein methyltransferase CheR